MNTKLLALTVPFLLILACGCKNKTRKQLTKDEKLKVMYDYAEWKLRDQKEKIILLSITKHISYDTLFTILKEYDAAISDYQYTDSLDIICSEALTTISQEHDIDRAKLAALIFSFKYEMQTQEEMEEKIISNLENEAAQEEPYDPRY